MSFMNSKQLDYFKASSGAYSPVTHREATGDKSVTVDRDEKQVLYTLYNKDVFAKAGIEGSHISPDKEFNVYNPITDSYERQQLAIKYPKRGKTELRLYFRAPTKFYPTDEQYWFIFTRPNEPIPFIGQIDIEKWHQLEEGDAQQKHYEFDYSIDEEDYLYQQAIASPKPLRPSSPILVTRQNRDASLAVKSIKLSNYKCQIDGTHDSFTSAITNKPFMEVHHLIPISRYKEFDHSLDVESNLIVLCPNCHRAIHHSIEEVRKVHLTNLYNQRSGQLEEAGISIELTKLLEFYGISL